MSYTENDKVFRDWFVELIKGIPYKVKKTKRYECKRAIDEYCNSLTDDIEVKEIAYTYKHMLEYYCHLTTSFDNVGI